MKVITDESCTSYSSPGHPERPARVARTVEKLQSQTDLKIVWAQPGPVDEAAILRAHTAEHLARLDVAEDFDDDTPFHPGISKLARQSVGAALEGEEELLGGLEAVLRVARAGLQQQGLPWRDRTVSWVQAAAFNQKGRT